MILVVCPTGKERTAVRRKVDDVVWAKCGVGPEAARKWARRVGGDLVVLAGFSFGDAAPGTLVAEGGDEPGASRGAFADPESRILVEACETAGVDWRVVRASAGELRDAGDAVDWTKLPYGWARRDAVEAAERALRAWSRARFPASMAP